MSEFRYFKADSSGRGVYRMAGPSGWLYFIDGSTAIPIKVKDTKLLGEEISEEMAVSILGGKPWELSSPSASTFVQALELMAKNEWSIKFDHTGYYVLGPNKEKIDNLSWRAFDSVEKVVDALFIWMEHRKKLNEELGKLK